MNLALERNRQKQAGALPVAAHGAVGNAERFGHFLFGQPTEVAHLDDLLQAGIGLFEFDQRVVDGVAARFAGV